MKKFYYPAEIEIIPEFVLRICANQWCAGVIVRYGRVVKAAPICKKTMGMTVKEVQEWAKKRNAVVGFILDREFIHDVQEVAF